MSRLAWIYLFAVLLGATSLTLFIHQMSPALSPDPLTFVVLLTLAVFGQLLEVKYGRQSYYPHFVPFFAGVILLQPLPFFLLITIPHLVEWIKKGLDANPYPWYIQPFNIATHVISGLLAQQIFYRLGGSLEVFTLQSTVLASLGAIAIYTLINHVLVGQILVLARQISWKESGILDPEPLATDSVMMSLGYITTLLWILSPWLLLLVAAPFIAIERALRVPYLEKQAQIDGKTGLWNIHYFEERFGIELAQAQQLQQPLSVIMADLDLLRNINNTYGHLAGDMVIAGVGKIIQDTVHKSDIACRFGGEEYAILLPNVDHKTAAAIAERIRHGLDNTLFQLAPSTDSIHATMSIGIACFPQDGTTREALISQADIALYQAKIQGRNRIISTVELPQSTHLGIGQPTPERITASAQGPTLEPESPSAPSAAVPAIPQDIPAPASTPRGLWIFLAAVITLAVGTTVSGILTSTSVVPSSLLLFTALAVAAQFFQIQLYEKSAVSISMTIVFAAGVVCGSAGILATSVAVALVHAIRSRPKFYKLLFNWANHSLAGLGAVIFIHLPIHAHPLPFTFETFAWWIVPVLVATLYYYLCETGLIAIAIGLSERSSILAGWREQFQWLARQYIVMGIMGFFLALAYMVMGFFGFFVFLLPAVIMHLTQKEYVARTTDSVRELRRMNKELSQANAEIQSAKFAIEQLNEELFMTLAKIIDARDPYVSGHATKVADYARAIAQHLDLSSVQVEEIYQAGLLHDIGKLGIPEAILHKPARLTDQEYEQVKKHAVLGADFLQSSHGLCHLAPAVRHHHERWDGKGYPDRLQGSNIPLPARILAVCDAVEAMASDRPYHRAMPLPAILSELESGAGSQFDPTIVAGFMQTVEQAGPQWIVNSALTVGSGQIAPQSPLTFPSPSELRPLMAY